MIRPMRRDSKICDVACQVSSASTRCWAGIPSSRSSKRSCVFAIACKPNVMGRPAVSDADAMSHAAPVRVMRVISRMNVGGPSIHVSLLNAGLNNEGYDCLLVAGSEGVGEGSLRDLAE